MRAERAGGARPWYGAVSCLTFAIGAALFMSADAWDPLAGTLGLSALAAAALGVGLSVGRWKGLWASLLLVPAAALTRAEQPELFLFIGLPTLVVVTGLLIAVGVGARRLLRRSERMEGVDAISGAALTGLAGVALALGVYLDLRVVDRSPERPILIDEADGSYRGITVGAHDDRLLSRLGMGRPTGNNAPAPIGVDPEKVSGPSYFPIWTTRRYRDLVLFTSQNRVVGFLTTSRDAQTGAGAGVGDSLAVVERRHSGFRCEGLTVGSDATNPAYPVCRGLLPSGSAILLGGDPIDSIWVTKNYERLRGSPITRR